jgi:alkylhydroperoxidase/carboxymuconolactone decarboxylase family protein YurZ
MTIKDPERHARIRDEFTRRRGYWNDEWEVICGLVPDYMEAYTDVSAYAPEHGSLSPKLREFIYIATAGAVTHLFGTGERQHMRNAYAQGATDEELMALLALVSTTGIHTYLLTMSCLEDVAPGSTKTIAAARAAQNGAATPSVESVIARHRAIYGSVPAEVETAIKADPGFYDSFLGLAEVGFRADGPIPPKDAHLIMMAVHACATGLWAPGVKAHATAALAAGASPVEIADVCEQIIGMSVHVLSIGVPILVGLMAEREAAAGTTKERA